MSTTVGEGAGGGRDQMLTDANFTESEKFFVSSQQFCQCYLLVSATLSVATDYTC